MQYEEFSKFYDKLMYDCDYELWSQYLLCEIKRDRHTLNNIVRGVDLCCGSGNMTELLKRGNMEVFGVDNSEEMLKKAQEKARKHALKINYIMSDVTEFNAPRKLDFATMCLDGVNYIPPKLIEKLFANTFNELKKDGVFLFDISSKYKLHDFIGENVFYDDGDDITYLWTNSLAKDGSSVTYDIAFFVKEGELYKRFDESHTLYIYEVENLIELLKKAGFNSVEIFGDDLKSAPNGTDMRVNFIARK